MQIMTINMIINRLFANNLLIIMLIVIICREDNGCDCLGSGSVCPARMHGVVRLSYWITSLRG